MSKFIAAFTLCFFGAGIAGAQDFNATIKKIDGNKITINRSDKDNKFKDEVLIVSDKVKVTRSQFTIEDDGNGNFTFATVQVELKDGLKDKAFEKEVKARISTDKKNIITEIRLGGGLFQFFDDNGNEIEIPLLIPDLQIEIPQIIEVIPLRIEKP